MVAPPRNPRPFNRGNRGADVGDVGTADADFVEVRAGWHPSEAQLARPQWQSSPRIENRIRMATICVDAARSNLAALTQAIVASEDHRFWNHRGVDVDRDHDFRGARSGRRKAPWREHDHNAARVDHRTHRSGDQRRAKRSFGNSGTVFAALRDRTTMVETGNPRSIPQPCHPTVVSCRELGRRRA